MNEKEKYQVAEKKARQAICGEKCVCPKVKTVGCSDLCAVYQSLCKYYVESMAASLDKYSWDEIAKISADGKAEDKFRIGDEKTCVLYTGEELTFVILGFNHDELNDGKTAGITFGLKGLLDGRFEMNADCTNEGGWKESKMRTVYMERIYKLLPDELRKHIKLAVKTTSAGGCSENIEETTDKLFLFSEVEVFGETEYSAANEGEQYPYFEDEENRIKYRGTSAYYWWLRSPFASNSNYFCYVGDDGYAHNYFIASSGYGVCFGFCI